MRALVLDAQASAAVTVVQSLGRAGVEVHAVANASCIAFGSRYLARAIRSRAAPGTPAALDEIRELDATHSYTLVVPTTEFAILTMQQCGDADPLRCKAVLPPWASVETALDKTSTGRLARDLEIPVPAATTIPRGATSDYAGPYPVTLKSARSQVARDGGLIYAPVMVARDAHDRDRFLREWGAHTDIEQQTFCEGHGWAVLCLYDRGRLRWSLAHERLHELPLTGGASSYRRSVAVPPALHDAAVKLLDALRWHGVAMVEFRGSGLGDYVLLEINPRLWGSLPLAVAAGVDFPMGLYHLAAGEDPGPQPKYSIGRYMRNLERDLDWMRENWLADHRDPLLLTCARGKSVLEWLRPLLGVEAWDHFSLSDIRPGWMQLGALAARTRRALARRLAVARSRARMRHAHANNVRRLQSRDRKGLKLVFVCHGNICRSPLAEQVVRATARERHVTSVGVDVAIGRRSPGSIRAVARSLGVDLEQHRSRSLGSAPPEADELLLVMDPTNYDAVIGRFPSAAPQVVFLGMFCRRPMLTIPDPIHMTEAEAREVAEEIEGAVARLLEWLDG